jgi:proline iminopeptidase
VIEPYASGLLDVGDGNSIYWDISGNPNGKAAVFVHGGPGSSPSGNQRKSFDLATHRVVIFHQRGCGRSTPSAADPTTDMSVNTTHHLIADMELLREHLGIDKWLLFGGSWGSTLALAYAEEHPQRVSEIVLVSVTNSRRSELDWLYRGAGMFFPEAWQRFRAGVPEEERDGDLLTAYARLMEHPDPAVRLKAAKDWTAWEDAVLSTEEYGKANIYSDRPDDELIEFVRICAHYFSHAAWLEEGQILKNIDRLAGIPAVLIHGRADLSGPIITAWELAQKWPDARLVPIEGAGHRGSEAMGAAIGAAIAEFAGR